MAAGIAAIIRLRGEIVVAADMTIGARRNLSGGCQLMGIGEWKSGGGMIKFAVGPGSDGMATGTSGSGRGEIRSDVIGHIATESLRLVPIGLMACEAISGIQGIVVVDVATGARRGGVGTR